ncbi:MAG TPA: recombinase family protein, partial [Candidatus Saccharimonadales bacterium]|nr:recombinase family protein [Candidatus Saccharimonadales bacterium]
MQDINFPIPNAVLYLRVSTEEQAKNLSLSVQRKHCMEYCDRQGWRVLETFTGKGESAKTVNRKELKNLLAYCRNNPGKVQYVVVYDVTRFARNAKDHLELRELLKEYGVQLRSTTEILDETPAGEYIELLHAGRAQLDNRQRTEKTKEGMKAAWAIGQWTHRAPLGYLNAHGPDGRPTLIPDPERAAFVRKAFELYATGTYTKRQVLKRITDQGLRTRNGRPLSPQSFGSMLSNPIYSGILVVTTTKIVNGKRVAESWGHHKRGNFEALVGDETFERVQSILAGKKPAVTPYQRNNPDYPLRRLVKCGRCGRPLTGSPSKGRSRSYPYYHCCNRNCYGVRVPKTVLENAFLQHLERVRPNTSYWDM